MSFGDDKQLNGISGLLCSTENEIVNNVYEVPFDLGLQDSINAHCCDKTGRVNCEGINLEILLGTDIL